MTYRQLERERDHLHNRLQEQPDSEDIEIHAPRLDYADPFNSDATAELPPAWEPKLNTWTVGYEPIGTTSIGVEQERRSRSHRRGFRVKSTEFVDYNEGRQSSRLAVLDKQRLTQTLCSRLGIGGLIQEEAVRAMLALDLDPFGGHEQIERVALAVISVITDYHRQYKYGDPAADRLGSDPTFKMLSHEFGLADDHTQLSRRVEEELRDIEFFDPGAPGLGRFERPATTDTAGAAVGEPSLRYSDSVNQRG